MAIYNFMNGDIIMSNNKQNDSVVNLLIVVFIAIAVMCALSHVYGNKYSNTVHSSISTPASK